MMRELVERWRKEAARHRQAQQELFANDREGDGRDFCEYHLHGESARTYDQCADELQRELYHNTPF